MWLCVEQYTFILQEFYSICDYYYCSHSLEMLQKSEYLMTRFLFIFVGSYFTLR